MIYIANDIFLYESNYKNEKELEDEENPLYKKFPFQVSTFLFYLYKEEDWYSLEIKNIDNELVLRIFFFTGFFTEEWLNKLISIIRKKQKGGNI